MSRKPLLRFVMVAAMAVPLGPSLLAQTVGNPPPGPAVERIDLPASRQDEWPQGVDRLTPVSREEFVRLWKLSRPVEAGPLEVPYRAATFRGVL
jgi:hypothetical protein